MTNGPTRLVHEDPGFARLAVASRAEKPSSEQLDKALACAADAAVSSQWRFAWRDGIGARMAIGVAVVGVAIIGIATMREERSTSEVGVGPVAASVALPNPSSPAVTGEVAAPTVSVNDLADAPLSTASAQRRVAVRSSSVRASADPGVGPGTFREELALVSAARSSLETGDAAACMRTVDRYDDRFHAGLFAHEIEVLRIEALAVSGDRAMARSRAEKFLAVNAKSPYAERVRFLVEGTTN